MSRQINGDMQSKNIGTYRWDIQTQSAQPIMSSDGEQIRHGMAVDCRLAKYD